MNASIRGHKSGARGGVLLRLLALMAVLAAITILAWMLLLPTVVEKVISGNSHFSAEVRQFALNPLTGTFRGGRVELKNSAEFGGGVFTQINEFKGVAEIRSVARTELVLETLSLDITKLVLAVNASGKSNLANWDETADGPQRYTGPEYALAGFPVIGEGPSQVMIRRLAIKIGRLEVLDLAGDKMVNVGDDINFAANYENVRSVEQLLTPELIGCLLKSPELWKALISSGAVPGLDRGDNPVHNLMEKASGVLNSLFRKLEQTGKP